jgi:hypothetical protein
MFKRIAVLPALSLVSVTGLAKARKSGALSPIPTAASSTSLGMPSPQSTAPQSTQSRSSQQSKLPLCTLQRVATVAHRTGHVVLFPDT